MTKAATIKSHRFLCLVAAAAMVIVTVMALVVPKMAMAAENEGITGSFEIGNEAPVLTEAATLYDATHTSTVTQMTPQTEYSIKVTVADTGTLDDLDTVVVTIFYDSDGDDDSGDIPAADTQTSFIMTCTVGSTPSWAGNPSASTTWTVETGNCVQPTLSGASGDFWFNFKPGKVATEALDWDVYIVVTDDNTLTDTYYDVATGEYDMLWYGEIDVTTASVDWGSVLAGMAFDNAAAKETVAINYISNGDWDAEVATEATWSTTATLDIDGTPGANSFSLKAWSADVLASAQFVTTTAGDCVIDDTGTLTGETGSTNSANTLYLDLGTPFVDGIYSGTITFHIVNG